MFEVSNLDKPRAAKQASDSEPQLKAAIRVVEATRNYFRVAGRNIPKAKFDQLKASHDDAMDGDRQEPRRFRQHGRRHRADSGTAALCDAGQLSQKQKSEH